MKHKLKRIFNSRMLSRALITVITCSIIFSYAVLCPQADSSTVLAEILLSDYYDLYFNSVYESPISFVSFPKPNDYIIGLGSELTSSDIGFIPDGYLIYTLSDSSSTNDLSFELSYDVSTYLPRNCSYAIFNFTFCSPSVDTLHRTFHIYFSDSSYNNISDRFEFSVSSVSGPFNELVSSQSFYVLNYSCIFDVKEIDFREMPILNIYLSFKSFIPDLSNSLVYCPYINPSIEYSTLSLDTLVPLFLSDLTYQIETTNSIVTDISNTLTNVTPEMQESINNLETLIQDEQEKIDDVITEMGNIGTDFGTEIGDFDNILNENAGTLEDIGSTTYNSFINDVFGNWFFVSMFALFGAFAFFSRAVFG